MKFNRLYIRIIGVLLLFMVCNNVSAQMLGIKTNAVLWANLTPNLSMELVSTKKTSIELTAFYSLDKTPLKTNLMGAQIEMRYWFSGRPMNRFFVGGSVTGLRYDSSLGKGSRHQGDAVAPGIVYGYALPIGKHWNIEFATGLGAFWYSERRYGQNDKDFWNKPYNENGFRMIPNKASISCVYLF